jgi:hypothetical protein
MSVLNVNSIASVEALNGALGQYRAASGEPFRRFAPVFEKKLELLEQLEAHFVERVEQAAHEVSYAQRAYSACLGDPNRTSCSYERSALHHAEAQLEQAQANLASYRSQISRLKGSLASYNSAAGRYENNLHNISSSIVPNFSSLIGEMKAYSYDDSNIAGGGPGNTIESSPSLSAFRTAAINAGVIGVANDGMLGGGADVAEAGAGTADGADGTYSDSGKISAENNGMGATLGDNATANVENANGISMTTVGGGIVAGVGVAALSAGILMHFRNNGVDSNFANKEIERALTTKYGAPLGLLPPEKQAEYVKDYNALSKAVEEDVKKKQQQQVEDKHNFTPLEKFKNYNNSLIDKRKELLKEANEWELRDRIYSICSNPVNAKLDKERINKALHNFKEQHFEMGFSVQETNKKLEEIYVQMEDESFRRNAPRSSFTQSNSVDFIDVEHGNKFEAKLKSDNIGMIEQPDAWFDLGIGLKNAPREAKLANQNHLLKEEAQTLLKNIKSNDKLITQIENNDFRGTKFKFSKNIVNGCGCEQAGVLEKAATKAGQGLDFLVSGAQSQTQSCNQHDLDYYNGVPKEIADNDFQKRSPVMGTAVKMAKATSQNAYNNAQQQRIIDEALMQRDFNNQVQSFHISGISEAPTIEDSSLKYFQKAAKEEGIIGIVSKK